MSFKYPSTIAPMSAKETYMAKTRCETRDQTAAMAGRVVVGPAMRKASAAAGLIPWARSPLTIFKNNRAVRSSHPRAVLSGVWFNWDCQRGMVMRN